MQAEYNCGFFGQLLDFSIEHGTILVVQEAIDENNSSTAELDKDSVNFLLNCTLLLHSFGISGIKYDKLSCIDGQFKLYEYLVFGSQSTHETDDLHQLGNLIKPVLEKTGYSEDFENDLKSGNLLIFEIFKKYDIPVVDVPKALDDSIPYKLYLHWKKSGRNPLKEYYLVNKRAYYPILDLPKSSNLLAEVNTIPQVHKDVVVGLEEAETDFDRLKESRWLAWVSRFNSETNYTFEYLLYRYNQCIKDAPAGELDRQLEVDIPRCHSYHALISSPVGHFKLKRLIKSLFKLRGNEHLVYWQGLDSIAATFLSTCFYRDHLSLFLLDSFIQQFLTFFFVEDNSKTIHAYLETFQCVIGFFEPEIASHLASIEYWPDLYAIPWFLTFFSHTFSIRQLTELWDNMFNVPMETIEITLSLSIKNSRVFSVFIALAILRSLKSQLLNADFHECVHIIGELNFQKSMSELFQDGLNLLKLTPTSIFTSIASLNQKESELNERRPSIFGNGRMRMASISIRDYKNLSFSVIIDIRSIEIFRQAHYKRSLVQSCWLDMPDEILTEKFLVYKQVSDAYKGDQFYCVIVGDDGMVEKQVAQTLINLGVPGVGILKGGFENTRAEFPELICTCEGTNLPDGTLACMNGK